MVAATQNPTDLDRTVQRLAPRWFVMRNAQTAVLMQPRQTISLLRGPMTRSEIRRGAGVEGIERAAAVG